MRSLSETGADQAGKPLAFADAIGSVIVITERPTVEYSEQWKTWKAWVEATDEESGTAHIYVGGGVRLLAQARQLADTWTEPVRCRITGHLNYYKKMSAWLEEAPAQSEHPEPAPPAKTRPTPPIYSELELQARERTTRLAEELRMPIAERQELVRVHSDEMGRIDWPAILEAVGDLATKRKLADGMSEQQATAKTSRKPASVH